MGFSSEVQDAGPSHDPFRVCTELSYVWTSPASSQAVGIAYHMLYQCIHILTCDLSNVMSGASAGQSSGLGEERPSCRDCCHARDVLSDRLHAPLPSFPTTTNAILILIVPQASRCPVASNFYLALSKTRFVLWLGSHPLELDLG